MAFALLLGALAFATGCATRSGTPSEGEGPTSAEALMLDDLARALEQLHAPRTTTVQVTRDGDRLTEAFAERLAESGYGVQWVDADQGAYRVTLAVSDAAPVGGDRVTRLELEVGLTRLARSYALTADGVRPVSPLSIGGTRGRVALADARFGDDVEPRHERVIRTGSLDALQSLPLISLVTDDIVAGVAREAAGGPSLAAVNSQRVEVSNLYYDDGNVDAFGAIDTAYTTAESTVVIFANDSMRLGSDGKRVIARFVDDYRESTDLIGLIGCSNGPTALEIGNEGLALGRSRRVAEELLALGIARERIVDEGCWAPTSVRERFPSRGVVMELLRKPS